ncbi:hypothetical protein J5X98_04080 [Leptothermofonsia sichuanensis E412]|uniref:hypothetical protein n=1 Tax=Leptothermofonsia sichuanensis TaxID=2917832 RepID=UPI001CA733C0|nr:hypothetical protein [Leptothermofonsia sichuanensis]QZZ21645.1 hypothetical protein J5X98_04080 [Leptothermofonsia sichuanensis E412]
MSETYQRPTILKPGESYTFRRYFELRFNPADILQELGASLQRSPLTLPKISAIPAQFDLAGLQKRLEQAIVRVSLTSEAARREALVAPVLLEIANLTDASINIEYPIEVNQYLRGEIDYFLQSQHSLLIVEAKQADLTRGFTQLAVELLACDRWITSDDPILYGAVTTGDIWQFGSLNRASYLITQDTLLYRIPTDLVPIVCILAGILAPERMNIE